MRGIFSTSLLVLGILHTHSFTLIPQRSFVSSLHAKTKTLDPEIATIQILMSDTGGGHRASANALRDAFDKLHPGRISVDIVDIYTDYGPFWPYNDYVRMYKLLAKYSWSWGILYHFGATPIGMFLNRVLLETFCTESFTKCLERPSATGQRADMVVSVHPLCQDVPLKILETLENGSRTTPFCTVVTDLGSAHPTWFHPDVDQCFVPSKALYQAAQDRGLLDKQIVQHGLPIRQGFWNAQASSKSALGLDEKLPTVLVVGGGDGMGGLVDIATQLGQTLKDCQLVVVCGSNAQAKEDLQSVNFQVPVSIQGFVNNMDEYMRTSDVLVTKAGPGTIAEASICGLPCMMFSFL